MTQREQNQLHDLQQLGQSIWLDYIRRNMLGSGGDLQRLIAEGLRGMTANPTIFQQAIAAGDDYDETIARLLGQGAEPLQIYEGLAAEDIRVACDLFRSVYDASNGADGFVSLEVAPSLAHDTEGTIEEARRFWKMVDRPNLMIKVPGTDAGAPAVEQLLYEGLNINVTLLFSLRNYERVARAYVAALERRAAEGKPIGRIASVASFFVSRVDTLVNELIDERLTKLPNPTQRGDLERLRSKAAIANAKLAYERFKTIFGGDGFAALRSKGAMVQRPLWASTSVKDPALPELMYVENLIGPDTVNTLPRETLDSLRDHGVVRLTIEEELEDARRTLETLAEHNIEYDAVTAQLEREGVEKFSQSFDKLLEGIIAKREALLSSPASVR